jgi:hypothetical protein
MDLKKFVYNEFVGFQKCYCLDKLLTPEEFISFVKHLELKSGLNLMAETEGETLDGFVTKTQQVGKFCDWGNHPIQGDHTSIIVTLYEKDKPAETNLREEIDPTTKLKTTVDVGNKNVFRKVNPTPSLIKKLDDAHREKLV